MGLHICYELALPAETTRLRVLQLLEALRTESERIAFDETCDGWVSPEG